MAVEPGEHCKESNRDDEWPELCVANCCQAESRKSGKSTAEGEQDTHQEFFWKKTGASGRPSAGQVNSREISQSGYGKGGVPLAYGNRHQDEDDGRGSDCGRDRQGNQQTAAAPMKVVALAQPAEIPRADSRTCVKEAVAD